MALSILHLDTGKEWRGGQQQAIYLYQKLLASGIESLMICPRKSPMKRYCAENKLPVKTLSVKHSLDVFTAFRISQIARQRRASILHLHTGNAISLGLLTKSFYKTVKLVATRRVDFKTGKNQLSRWKYNTDSLDKIVCISEKIHSIMLESGVPPGKMTVIHSGVDLNKFRDVFVDPVQLKQEIGIPADALLIGTVAAMAGHKDYPNLLNAAAEVVKVRENVFFCAVGDGPLEPEIRQLAKELDLDNRFVFAGFREDVGHFLKSFDIFVLASKHEGLGTSLLDAQALGLSIVACDSGGIPEIIEHEQSGLLVPPRNSKALADGLLRLIDDKALRERLGKNARHSVKAFDINLTVEKYIDLYRELIGE
jgi:glycosyltransferase involved in cell wall biosynthesis